MSKTKRQISSKADVDKLRTEAARAGLQITASVPSMRGLHMRVRPLKEAKSGQETTATWQWVRLYGPTKARRTKRETLGNYPAVSLEMAKRRAAELEANFVQRAPTGRGILFDTLCDEFLERQVANGELKPKTAEDYRRYLARNALPQLKNLPAADITTDQIRAIVKAAYDRGSQTASNRLRATLSAVFKYGNKWHKEIRHNPVRDVPRFGKEKARNVVIEPATLRLFWQAIGSNDERRGQSDTSMTLPMRLIARLVVLLGQRVEEIASLRRDEIHHIDTDEPVLIIRDTKRDREQWVPISPLARIQLGHALRLSAGGDYVFASTGTKLPHIRPDSVSKAMDRTRRKLGISNIGMHDMRKVVATYLREQGTQLEIIQRMLNHAPKNVTEKHYEFSKMLRPLRQAYEQWEKTLTAISDGTISRYEQIGEWAENTQVMSDEQLAEIVANPSTRAKLIKMLA